MKTKITLLLFMVMLLVNYGWSQVDIGGSLIVCPGENVSYSSSPVSTNNQSCTYKWTVTNGVFSNGQTTYQGQGNTFLDVTVIWNNVQATSNTEAPKGTLKIEVSGCSLPSGERTYDDEDNIVIKTLNGVTPANITGDDEVAANITTAKTYSIPKVQFPNTGTSSGWSSSVYADSYQWVIPAGWKLDGVTSNGSTPFTGKGESVSLTPDAFSEGIIKVRAYSECNNGYTSNWSADFPISRTVATPSAITGNDGKDYVVCGVTEPITFQVTPVQGATSYIWTKPAGWGGASTTASITLTPNGTNAGTITVKAKSGPYVSAPSSRSLSLEIVDLDNPPIISGPSTLCTSNQTYTVNNPASATVTWSVSPANLFAVDAGSGSSFTTRADNYWVKGVGTIMTTLNSNCGNSFTKTKTVWVGKPDQPVTDPSGYPTVQMNLGELLAIRVTSAPGNVYQYNWDVTGSIQQISGGGSQIVVEAVGTGFGNYKVQTQNDCGLSTYGGGSVNVSSGGGGLFMSFTPNSITGETVMELKTEKIAGYNDNEEWEMAIYDNQMMLMRGPVSAKGSKYRINTLGWKNGLYIVKLMLKDRVLNGKFVVER